MTHRLDALVAATAPVTDDRLDALDLSRGEAELHAALLDAAAAERGEAHTAAAPIRPRSARSRRRRLGMTAFAACLALVAAIAGVSLTREGEVATGPTHAWAAAAVRVAEAVPRILIDQPGWRVERADEFTVRQGETTFANDRLTVELTWRPPAQHGGYVSDRANGSTRIPGVEVLGHPAAGFRVDTNPRVGGYATVLWRDGKHSLELRVWSRTGDRQLSREHLLELIGSLRLVSVDAWLSAMPASVVQPTEQRTEIERLVADMRLPPGFDVATLLDKGAVRDRYQLHAHVMSGVACAWIERWVEARRSGDARAAEAAVAALGDASSWTAVREMRPSGGYDRVLADHVAAMAGDGTIAAGRPLRVQDSYRNALGCG